LLAKLAWDFTPEQLDHLFECFQASWSTASAKQHEKLLELIRRLAEDDKDGVMAEKVEKTINDLKNRCDQEDQPSIVYKNSSKNVEEIDFETKRLTV